MLAATAGSPIASNDLAGALKARLVPKALLATPNIAEAEELTGVPIRGDDSMRHACIELYQLGCEYAQGYAFGYPMTVDEATKILTADQFEPAR